MTIDKPGRNRWGKDRWRRRTPRPGHLHGKSPTPFLRPSAKLPQEGAGSVSPIPPKPTNPIIVSPLLPIGAAQGSGPPPLAPADLEKIARQIREISGLEVPLDRLQVTQIRSENLPETDPLKGEILSKGRFDFRKPEALLLLDRCECKAQGNEAFNWLLNEAGHDSLTDAELTGFSLWTGMMHLLVSAGHFFAAPEYFYKIQKNWLELGPARAAAGGRLNIAELDPKTLRLIKETAAADMLSMALSDFVTSKAAEDQAPAFLFYLVHAIIPPAEDLAALPLPLQKLAVEVVEAAAAKTGNLNSVEMRLRAILFMRSLEQKCQEAAVEFAMHHPPISLEEIVNPSRYFQRQSL